MEISSISRPPLAAAIWPDLRRGAQHIQKSNRAHRNQKTEMEAATMKMRTGIDLELRSLLRAEMETLKEYVGLFDSMTAGEKDGLREWMAHGNSVNSNPYSLYGENGSLMDYIAARRTAEDMAANPQDYYRGAAEVPEPEGGIPF